MTKWTRALLGAGLIAAVVVGCGEEDSGNTSNNSTGGSDNTGGGAGSNTGGGNTGGGNGTGASAGETGEGGEGGEGGAGGADGVSDVCADGCAVLSAPLTAAEQHARFQFFIDPTDLSTETLTFRVFVKAGGPDGGLQYGFQNGEALGWAGIYPWKNLADLTGQGWQDITIDMTQYAPAGGGEGGAGGAGGAGNEPGAPDSSKVQIINLWIESGSGAGPWASPSIVYVDSVKSSDGTVNYEFESNVSALNASGDNVEGSSATHTTLDP
jgi:hypothetical protein